MLETANHVIHSNSVAEEKEPKSQPCLSDIVSLKWGPEINMLISIWDYDDG